MKSIEKSSPEPIGLSDYRNANPKATWDRFKDEAQTAHKAVKKTLSEDQAGLCAYCEIDVIPNIDQRVEHYHPKGDKNGNWDLIWNNLLLCCHGGEATATEDNQIYGRSLPPTKENRSCDAIKEGQILDSLILNPCQLPTERLFKFLGDGTIQVDTEACESAGVDTAKANNTIRHLNLNCRRLQDARAAIIEEIEEAKVIARENTDTKEDAVRHYDALIARHLGRGKDNRLKRFFTARRWALGSRAELFLDSGS